MTWIMLLGSRYDGPTADDITQIHYLARMDRGGASPIEIRVPGRLLDSYHVTMRTARAILRCLRAHCTAPLMMAMGGLASPTIGPNPILDELVRVQDRYRRWT